jgi:hypothetical protein
MAAKQQNGMLAPAAKFVASLIFLYVVFGPLNAMAAPGLGNLWTPLLYAAAVLGSITMFFAGLAGFSQMMPRMCGCKVMMVTPFAILALVAITPLGAGFATAMWLTVIGAVLAGFSATCCCMQK